MRKERDALGQPQQGCSECGVTSTDDSMYALYCVACIDKMGQPQQEPVADGWSVFNIGAEVASGLSLSEALEYMTPARIERGWSAVCVLDKGNPPNTTPPRREWVELTEDEVYAAIKGINSLRAIEVARVVEARLKEKNYD